MQISPMTALRGGIRPLRGRAGAVVALFVALALFCATAKADQTLEDAYDMLAAGKQRQAVSSITLTIGSVPGVIGQKAFVPVFLESEMDAPSIIILKMQFDDTRLRFGGVELGQTVPAGKRWAAKVHAGNGSLPAYVAVIVYGRDKTAIGDGTLLVAEFDVIGGEPGDVVALKGLDLDSSEASSAVTSARAVPESLIVFVEDGQIGPLIIQSPDTGDGGGCAVGGAGPKPLAAGDVSLILALSLILASRKRARE